MESRRLRIVVAVALGLGCCCAIAQAEVATSDEVLRVWPADAPGSEVWSGPEFSEEAPHPSGRIRLERNVSVPTLTVYRPAAGRGAGTAMLVLPGGAFGALAWDLEGTEVARWLADRGVTAFLLKYRVRSWPIPPGVKIEKLSDYIPILEQGRKIAVADASEAVRLVRRKAGEYEIEPDRVGMIGFSAGAIAIYGVVFESDASARPDFIAPIYGMTMIESPVLPADAPPLFVVVAQDDGLITAQHNQQIYDLWNNAKRPVEMHLFEKGGHGFGMRPQNKPIDAWPAILEASLRSHGWIQ